MSILNVATLILNAVPRMARARRIAFGVVAALGIGMTAAQAVAPTPQSAKVSNDPADPTRVLVVVNFLPTDTIAGNPNLAQFSFLGTGMGGTAVPVSYVNPMNATTITLVFLERAVGTNGGSLTIGSGALQDNSIPPFPSNPSALPLVVTDNAGPVMVSAITSDTNANGKIDQIIITYSETVTLQAGAASHYTVRVGNVNYPVTGAAVAANKVTLTVGEQATPDSGATPVIFYRNPSPGNGTDVVDVSNNAQPSDPNTTVTATVGVHPVMISAITKDTNGNGFLDAVDITFSEPVKVTDLQGNADALLGFVVAGYTIQTANYSNANTSTLRLNLVEKGPGIANFDTGVTPNITYTAGPNSVNSVSSALELLTQTITPADGAVPVVKDVRMNGRSFSTQRLIGYPGQHPKITIVFSEAMAPATNITDAQTPIVSMQMANGTVVQMTPPAPNGIRGAVFAPGLPNAGTWSNFNTEFTMERTDDNAVFSSTENGIGHILVSNARDSNDAVNNVMADSNFFSFELQSPMVSITDMTPADGASFLPHSAPTCLFKALLQAPAFQRIPDQFGVPLQPHVDLRWTAFRVVWEVGFPSVAPLTNLNSSGVQVWRDGANGTPDFGQFGNPDDGFIAIDPAQSAQHNVAPRHPIASGWTSYVYVLAAPQVIMSGTTGTFWFGVRTDVAAKHGATIQMDIDDGDNGNGIGTKDENDIKEAQVFAFTPQSHTTGPQPEDNDPAFPWVLDPANNNIYVGKEDTEHLSGRVNRVVDAVVSVCKTENTLTLPTSVNTPILSFNLASTDPANLDTVTAHVYGYAHYWIDQDNFDPVTNPNGKGRKGVYDPGIDEIWSDRDFSATYTPAMPTPGSLPTLPTIPYYRHYWVDDPAGTPGVYDPGIDEIWRDNVDTTIPPPHYVVTAADDLCLFPGASNGANMGGVAGKLVGSIGWGCISPDVCLYAGIDRGEDVDGQGMGLAEGQPYNGLLYEVDTDPTHVADPNYNVYWIDADGDGTYTMGVDYVVMDTNNNGIFDTAPADLVMFGGDPTNPALWITGNVAPGTVLDPTRKVKPIHGAIEHEDFRELHGADAYPNNASGFALYREAGGAGLGTFGDPDNPAVVSKDIPLTSLPGAATYSPTWTRMSVNHLVVTFVDQVPPNANSIIPANDSLGNNVGPDWYMTFKTSPSMSQFDDFMVVIRPEDGIGITDGWSDIANAYGEFDFVYTQNNSFGLDSSSGGAYSAAQTPAFICAPVSQPNYLLTLYGAALTPRLPEDITFTQLNKPCLDATSLPDSPGTLYPVLGFNMESGYGEAETLDRFRVWFNNVGPDYNAVTGQGDFDPNVDLMPLERNGNSGLTLLRYDTVANLWRVVTLNADMMNWKQGVNPYTHQIQWYIDVIPQNPADVKVPQKDTANVWASNSGGYAVLGSNYGTQLPGFLLAIRTSEKIGYLDDFNVGIYNDDKPTGVTPASPALQQDLLQGTIKLGHNNLRGEITSDVFVANMPVHIMDMVGNSPVTDPLALAQPQQIAPESEPTAILGLDMCDNGKNEDFLSVTLKFANVNGFSPSDLLPVGVDYDGDGKFSAADIRKWGVAVYRHNPKRGTPGVFNPDTDIPVNVRYRLSNDPSVTEKPVYNTVTGGVNPGYQPNTYWVGVPDSSAYLIRLDFDKGDYNQDGTLVYPPIPDTNSGADAGSDYYVVIRTSSSIGDGDMFNVTIEREISVLASQSWKYANVGLLFGNGGPQPGAPGDPGLVGDPLGAIWFDPFIDPANLKAPVHTMRNKIPYNMLPSVGVPLDAYFGTNPATFSPTTNHDWILSTSAHGISLVRHTSRNYYVDTVDSITVHDLTVRPEARIDVENGPMAVLGLDVKKPSTVAGGVATATDFLEKVVVDFKAGTGLSFTADKLAALKSGVGSGVALYRDVNGNGVFDAAVDTVVASDIQADPANPLRFIITPKVPEVILDTKLTSPDPANADPLTGGPLEKDNFFILVRTSATLNYLDGFQVAATQVKTSQRNYDFSASPVWSRLITANVPTYLTSAIRSSDRPLYNADEYMGAFPAIGINARDVLANGNDGTAMLDQVVVTMLAPFPGLAAQTKFTQEDLMPLSTDGTTSGVALYADTNNDGIFDAGDTALPLDGIHLEAVNGVYTVRLTVTPNAPSAMVDDQWDANPAQPDFFVVIRPSPTATKGDILLLGVFNNDTRFVNATGDGSRINKSISVGMVMGQNAANATDADGNGLPDAWEIAHFGRIGVNPNADPDGDGLTNYYEYLAGTDPNNPDTAGNGVGDGQMDTDGDGLTNVQEQLWGTDPSNPDTDDDGIPDGTEIAQRTSPLHSINPLINRSLDVAQLVPVGNGVQLPAPERVNFNGSSWTVESWVRLPAGNETGSLLTSTVPFRDLSGFDTSVSTQTQFDLRLNGGRPSLTCFMANANGTKSGVVITPIAAKLAANRWYHVAGIFDATAKTLSVVLDGSVVYKTDVTDGMVPVSGTGTLELGKGLTAGLLDEVRIWSQAIGVDQLDRNRRGYVAMGTSGLLLYYRFDDGGLTAQDFAFLDGTMKNIRAAAKYVLTIPAASFVTVNALGTTDGFFAQADDSNNNGMPDWFESFYGVTDPSGDADGDGLTNLYEYLCGTNPIDTTNGTADASADLDGDGLTNKEEQQFGTDPRLVDTDNDGLTDYEEVTGKDDLTTPMMPSFTHRPGVDAFASDPLLPLQPLNADRRGLQFTGVAGMTVPNSGKYANASWTVMAWVKPTAAGTIFSRQVSATGINYELGLSLDGTVLRPYGRFVTTANTEIRLGGAATGADANNLFTKLAVTAGEWTHIAATFDQATYTMTLYVNGMAVAQRIDKTTRPLCPATGAGILTGPELSATATMTIGGSGYAGAIDELQISGGALVARQIATDFRSEPTTATGRVPGFGANAGLRQVVPSATEMLKRDHVAHRILVKFKPSQTVAQQTAIHTAMGVTVLHKIKLTGLQVIDVPATASLAEKLSQYLANPGVEYAEPDYLVHAFTVPNDSFFSKQWTMHNTGEQGGVPGADIHAAEAWDLATGSADSVVCVIDTGIDYNHQDLAANIWTNPGEIAGNGIDDDGNGYVDDVHGYNFSANTGDPMDDNGHGTHCAGNIGGVGNNGTGIAGVNWKCKIMALKFLGADGSGSNSDAIRAVDYSVMMGVKVSSNSWGGGGYDQALYDAINAAGKAGQIFIAAAGNESSDNDLIPSYPASYELNNIISVAATNFSDQLSYFSCYGKTSVDLAAPGGEMYFANDPGGSWSTLPGNQYGYEQGTSMATPLVAGAAALLRSVRPSASYQDLKSWILGGVDVSSGLQSMVASGGRLNLYNSLVLASSGGRAGLVAHFRGVGTADETHVMDLTEAENWQLSTNGQYAATLGAGASFVSVKVDPTAVAPVTADTDGDGMPDWYEIANGFDPASAADGAADADGDGLTNYYEYLAKTNPYDPVTDGVTPDANRDSDGDGMSNIDEQTAHSNPGDANANTDDDGDTDTLAHRLAATDTEEVKGRTKPDDAMSPYQPRVLSLPTAAASLRLPNQARFALSSSWTVEAWVKIATADINGGVVIRRSLDDDGDSTLNSVNYELGYTAAKKPYVRFTSNSATGNIEIKATAGFAITADAWHHLAGVYDATTKKVILYVDTYPVIGALTGGVVPAASEIGVSQTVVGVDMVGSVDGVRIWNYAKTDFSTSGIASTPGNESVGVVASYQFDDGGITAQDFAKPAADWKNAWANAATLVGGALMVVDDFSPVVDINKDTNGNGMPDWWQLEHFGHLGVDPNADADGDGLSNLYEYLAGTDPNNPRTDGWNLDGEQDADGDGLTNAEEQLFGTRPDLADTDDDGASDLAEVTGYDANGNFVGITSPVHPMSVPPPANLAAILASITDPQLLAQQKNQASRNMALFQSLLLSSVPATGYPLPHADRFSFGAKGWTFECWMRPGTDNTGDIFEYVGQNGYGYRLSLDSGSPKGMIFKRNAATGVESTLVAVGGKGATPAVAKDVWTHLAFAWDPDNKTFRLYRDGILLIAQTSLLTPSVSPAASAVMARGFADGYMDDVRVWSYVRSAEEIEQWRDHVIPHPWGSVGIQISQLNPVFPYPYVADYRFDDGGQYVEDFAYMGKSDYMLRGLTVTPSQAVPMLGMDDANADGLPEWWVDLYKLNNFTPAVSGPSYVAQYDDQYHLTAITGISYSSQFAGFMPMGGVGWTDGNIVWEPVSVVLGYDGKYVEFFKYIDLPKKPGSAVMNFHLTAATMMGIFVNGTQVTFANVNGEPTADITAALKIGRNQICFRVTRTVTSVANERFYSYTNPQGQAVYVNYVHSYYRGLIDAEVVADSVAVVPFGRTHHFDPRTVWQGSDWSQWTDDQNYRAMDNASRDLPEPNLVNNADRGRNYGIMEDQDNDGLTVNQEFVLGTNPVSPESNNNGVSDLEEDPDGDGLTNHEELDKHTDPRLADTDDDGVNDGDEIAARSNPLDGNSPYLPRCIQMNGTATQFVELPIQNRFALDTFTIEAWVKPAALVPGGSTVIRRVIGTPLLSNSVTMTNYGIRLTAAGQPEAYFSDSTGTESKATAGGAIAVGAWTHLAMTVDGNTHAMTLYINGTPSSTTTSSRSPIKTGPGLVFTRLGESFNGYIDEVRIWSLVRTSSLILQKMNGLLAGSEAGLVAYYRFDDGGVTAQDSLVASAFDWTNGWRNAARFVGYPVAGSGWANVTDNAGMNGEDADHNGLPDWWEIKNFGAIGQDPEADPDGDGLNNLYEYLAGTDPNIADTGSTGVLDGEKDSDGDGLSNHYEQLLGTHPLLKDTDDDGVDDGDEVIAGTDPTSSLSPMEDRVLWLPSGTDIVSLPGGSRFALSNWAIEAQIRPEQMNGIILERKVSVASSTFRLELVNGYPTVSFTPSIGGANVVLPTVADIATMGMDPLYTTNTANTNLKIKQLKKWSHVAAVLDSTNHRLSLYVDGNLYASKMVLSNTAVIGTGPVSATIGGGFVGAVDEVRIWNVALTATDISALASTKLNVVVKPGLATLPQPYDQSINVAPNGLTLNWTPGSSATTQEVFFGASPITMTSLGTTVSGSLAIPSSTVVANGKTYYWRVDGWNAVGGVSTGTVWSFQTVAANGAGSATGTLTVPEQATVIAPFSQSYNVAITGVSLQWTPGTGATSHTVWFGTDPVNLTRKAQISTNSYALSGLQLGTSYFWRVDEVNANGTTMGTVWSFTTTSNIGGGSTVGIGGTSSAAGSATSSAQGLVGYYKFDDGTSYVKGVMGTSKKAGMLNGQVQEFALGFERDWLTGWANAGTLVNNAVIVPRNPAPTPPTVEIQPQTATKQTPKTGTLRVVVKTPSVDFDGNNLVSYLYKWYRNSVVIPNATGAMLDIAEAGAGVTFSVEVRGVDSMGKTSVPVADYVVTNNATAPLAPTCAPNIAAAPGFMPLAPIPLLTGGLTATLTNPNPYATTFYLTWYKNFALANKVTTTVAAGATVTFTLAEPTTLGEVWFFRAYAEDPTTLYTSRVYSAKDDPSVGVRVIGGNVNGTSGSGSNADPTGNSGSGPTWPVDFATNSTLYVYITPDAPLKEDFLFCHVGGITCSNPYAYYYQWYVHDPASGVEVTWKSTDTAALPTAYASLAGKNLTSPVLDQAVASTFGMWTCRVYAMDVYGNRSQVISSQSVQIGNAQEALVIPTVVVTNTATTTGTNSTGSKVPVMPVDHYEFDNDMVHARRIIPDPTLFAGGNTVAPPNTTLTAATTPIPYNNSTYVTVTPVLRWTGDAKATSYDVYFGLSESSLAALGTTAAATIDVGTTLALNTVYVWRVDSRGPTGTIKGNLWKFTTANDQNGTNTGFGGDTGGTGTTITGTTMVLSGSSGQQHTISPARESDWMWFTVPENNGYQKTRVTFETNDGNQMYSALTHVSTMDKYDTQVYLYDRSGKLLKFVDDVGFPGTLGSTRYARFVVDLLPGVYYVRVTSSLSVTFPYLAALMMAPTPGVAGPTNPTAVALAPAAPGNNDNLVCTASGSISGSGTANYAYVWYRKMANDNSTYGQPVSLWDVTVTDPASYEGTHYELAFAMNGPKNQTQTTAAMARFNTRINELPYQYTQAGEVWTCKVYAWDMYGISEGVYSASVTIGTVADWTLSVVGSFADGLAHNASLQSVQVGWRANASFGFDTGLDSDLLTDPLPPVPGGATPSLFGGRVYSDGFQSHHLEMSADFRPSGMAATWLVHVEFVAGTQSVRLDWGTVNSPSTAYPLTIAEVDPANDYMVVPGSLLDMTQASGLVVVGPEKPANGKYSRVYRISLGGNDYSDMLTLKYGWNLVSVGVVPANPSPDQVFMLTDGTSAKAGAVWSYDAASGTYVAATTIVPMKGYWVYCPLLNGAGVMLHGQQTVGKINLLTGWNLVGFISTVKWAAVDPKIQQISGDYDPVTNTYLMNSITAPLELQKSKGYWIKVSSPLTIDAQ